MRQHNFFLKSYFRKELYVIFLMVFVSYLLHYPEMRYTSFTNLLFSILFQKALLRKKGVQSRCLYLDVPGLAENRPSVLRGDKIFVRPAQGGMRNFEGEVEEVLDTEVRLRFADKLLSL